jgi:hypothetical protein
MRLSLVKCAPIILRFAKGATKMNHHQVHHRLQDGQAGRAGPTVSANAPARVLLAAVLIVLGLLAPQTSRTALAQGAPDACKNDAGVAVVPRPAAGVGAWLLVLNYNHAPSATTTTGCLVMTTAVNPHQVSRSLVACQILGNTGGVQVGNGAAPFDGNLSIVCPGILPGKQTLENFTIWGRASFGAAGKTYSIVQHPDVGFSAVVSPNWKSLFNSRYGTASFASGDPQTNIKGQVVAFMTAVSNLTGSHSLNGRELAPRATLAPFEYRFDQPTTIGRPGQSWILFELIIDPPGGCCKS